MSIIGKVSKKLIRDRTNLLFGEIDLKKPDGSIKPSEVQPDNKCALGQWIYGEGSKWSAMPEYNKLKADHARFHKAAAQVVTKADSGQDTSEETAIGSKSEFAMASNAVVQSIMAIRRKA